MIEHYVVYADDDKDDLELLEEAFSKYSKKIKFVTASDGRDAVNKLEELQRNNIVPCLVILDINMPFLSGKEVLQKLRSEGYFSETPIILFSTSNADTERQFAVKHKSVLITKPINVEHLERIADTFIEYCHNEVKKTLQQTG